MYLKLTPAKYSKNGATEIDADIQVAKIGTFIRLSEITVGQVTSWLILVFFSQATAVK